ncbi:MAG: DEAD/DEAH box helicase family protein [Candidatus Kaiserbacteria bacterium]|nr:DEAD/DEAH box helicase family protein [Candidatus Kaiserbacteria bacterium]
MQVIPRAYQSTAIKAALKGLRGRSQRALVVLATGLGKTLTAAFVAREFRAKRILFLVHNNFILEHAINEFRLVFSEKTSLAIYNGLSKKGALHANIVFATWQTMSVHLEEWRRNHFNLVIVDEAHHSEAGTYKPVLKYFTGPKLGITATPDREDEADIRGIFGREVIDITLEEAIARGWLPRIEYHVITDESLDDEVLQKIAAEIREAKKRFTMAEVNRRIFIKKRDEEVARIISGYNEKAVVFCASIAHAERMAKSLTLAATFHSNKGNGQQDTWKKNREVLENLKNGIIRRACAVNAFNEGVNVPSVGLVAFCRVTGALTIFRQQLGRGLRPGKDKLVVLDFVGNLERIQLVLEMMNKISDLHEKYTPRKDMEREGYTRESFEVSGKGFEFTFSDKVVDLMKVLKHCEREFYPTWQEASQSAISLGITNSTEYKMKYKKDPKLQSGLDKYYKDFPGWVKFCGRELRIPYPKWNLASQAAISLDITCQREYVDRYKEDPKLPSSPVTCYQDFPGWTKFLGKERYHTWQDASKAVISMGIRTRREYWRKFKEDPKLLLRPNQYYKDFPGFRKFLGKK